jgi:hypothetical protein
MQENFCFIFFVFLNVFNIFAQKTMQRGKDGPSLCRREMRANEYEDCCVDSSPIYNIERLFLKNIQFTLQHFENIPHYKSSEYYLFDNRIKKWDDIDNLKII